MHLTQLRIERAVEEAKIDSAKIAEESNIKQRRKTIHVVNERPSQDE